MPEEFESFAIDLAVSGYHAWNRLYDKMAGDLKVDFEEGGKASRISLGQLASKLDSPDRSIRKQAFEKLEAAWETRADYASMILNSIGGFRLTLYRHRKWDSALYEPLVKGRLKRETLDAMWRAVSEGVSGLVPYLRAKAKHLGIERFMWYDQTAPAGRSDRTVSFADAREFIVKNLGGFSEEMAEFSDRVFEERWIEAENRAGKAAGGFCTGFGHIKQSRIFMTYLDTYGDLMTLAHELGHAYHQHVLGDDPYFAREYPMNLAETASIFNELLVTDAALKGAEDEDERLMLLDQKLQRAHVMFCNLRARFIFDRNFYAERKNGVVPRERLDDLMVQAQREAFGETLDSGGYHPLFWASKLHFYLTDTPFYNFPYTFGFLFAGGVYDLANREGSAFAPKYRNLLRDTGSMTTEELAKKHLAVDLTKDDFWEMSVSRVLEDVDSFVRLAG
jgi:pepF/M3 family oligoendopeptidase